MALLGFLALTLALGAYAGVVDRLLALLKLLIPLALIMLVLQMAFMRDGNIVWGFITDTGLVTGSKACLRLLGVALPLILMLMVTKLNDLANACVEVLHVPYRYAFTFTTALRFVPVFGQEMNAIMEAQTARGIEYDTKNPIKKLQLMLPLCVPLLISSVGKTDATALAAEQRGFYLRTRASSYKRYPIKGLDIAVLNAIVRQFNGGPVGLNNLSAMVGEEAETVETVCEPYLVREGFLIRTPKGRLATAKAWEHLGLKPDDGTPDDVSKLF